MRIQFTTLVNILEDSARKRDVVAGRSVLSLVTEDNLCLNAKLICVFVKMFASCGNMPDALDIFYFHEKSVYTWSCTILACANHGFCDKAMVLYHQMQLSCIRPNSHTFVAAIKACKDVVSLDQVYTDITKQGIEGHHFVGNSLVDMYARHGNLMRAREVFDKLEVRSAVSWSAIITGYTNSGQGWEAIKIFHQMWRDDATPDDIAFLCILRACASVGALTEGRFIHTEFFKFFDLDVIVGSTLIDMYGKCNRILEAHRVFDQLPVRNAVCWNALIASYACSNHNEEVLLLFNAMECAGFEPNAVTYTSVLISCTNTELLKQGMVIHESIIRGGFETDAIIGNRLVHMYAKCGCLICACKVFDNLSIRDAISWTVMIAGHAEWGEGKQALRFYDRMRQEKGINPNPVTILSVIKACISMDDFESVKIAYSDCIEEGLESDVGFGVAMVDTFVKFASLRCAKRLFDSLSVRNVVSYSALISGYAEQSDSIEAFMLLCDMQREGIQPNEVTFVCLLKACVNMASLRYGMLLHAYILEQSIESILNVEATLVAMYSKCGSLIDALKIFDNSITKDVVIWSALIAGCSEHGHTEEALYLFQGMCKDGIKPNEVTLATVLKACAILASLENGKLVYEEIMKQRLQYDLFVGNTLVEMFAKCGDLESACHVFDQMRVHDVISWSTIIEGFANHGYSHLALQYFYAMQKHATKPVAVTYISIFSACCNAGLIDESYLFLLSMKNEHGLIEQAEHYACLVDLLGRAGQLELAEVLVLNLPIQSDHVVWMTLLGSCARLGFVDLGTRTYNVLSNIGRGRATAAILLSNSYAVNLSADDTTIEAAL